MSKLTSLEGTKLSKCNNPRNSTLKAALNTILELRSLYLFVRGMAKLRMGTLKNSVRGEKLDELRGVTEPTDYVPKVELYDFLIPGNTQYTPTPVFSSIGPRSSLQDD